MAGGPDDGADPGGVEVEVAGRRGSGRRSGMRLARRAPRRPSPWPSMCCVDAGEDSGRMRWSAAATVAGRSVASAHPVTVDRRSGGRPGGRRRPAGWRGRAARWSGAADQLQRRLAAARAGASRHLVDRLVETRRSGRATRRCPCPGSGEACGCGGRRRSSRRVRPRRSSSASWTPVAEAPTTSTPPAGSDRRGCGTRPGPPGGCPRAGARATAGTAGRSHQPVAMTTLSAGPGRRRWCTSKPWPRWRSELHGRVLRGRARRTRRRSRSRYRPNSAAVMNPSGSGPR